MRYVVATNNQGKLIEFQRILEPLGIELVSLRDIGLKIEVEETGTTFMENARLKAQAVMQASGLPAIADDSGLCVDALGSAPGVYSARYSGEHATDEANNRKLLDAMQGIEQPKRTAQFVSAICCCFPNGDRLETEGVCPGWVGFEPRGNGGFGYDPLFMTELGSYAEITPEQKDAISHRGKALRALYDELKDYKKGCE